MVEQHTVMLTTGPIQRGRRAWRWLIDHERLPETFDAGRAGRIALVIVAFAVVTYAVVLTLYVFGQHNTFSTNAEDLGIMDQVLWNTAHGHFMRESICNPVTDVNCLGGVSRFAIHFEPILIPLALLYVVAPSVKALLLLQVIVVASGAFPAYLLATRRLRSPVWGVLFAALLLVYPPLQAAVLDDFHPETLAATALMWALYCLTTRRYRALVVCCVLALLCKETLTLDVMMIGLFVAILHRRPRMGLTLFAVGLVTLGVALLLMRVTSPIGHSPVAGRLNGVTHNLVGTLLTVVRDPARRAYLIKLLAPVGFLPLLSPWVLAMAAPSILLNMISSDPLMYSGIYQYNTDIAPILLAAAIDTMVWLAPLFSRIIVRLRVRARALHAPDGLARLIQPQIVLALLVILTLGVGARSYVVRGYRNLTLRNAWPLVTAHDEIGDQIVQMIPADASVSAQSTLAPHVSERQNVYQFPSGDENAEYVFLDVTTGNFYPYTQPHVYVTAVQTLLNSCQFEVTAARDGYLLLHHLAYASLVRVASCAPLTLPPSFYTFATSSTFATSAPPSGALPTDVTYADMLQLVGYSVNPPQVYLDQPELTITTYWQALKPITEPLTVVITLTRPNGTRIVINDALTQEWLPPSAWTPGEALRVQTWPIYLEPTDRGDLLLGVEVRAGAPTTNPPATSAIPATVPEPAAPISGAPRLVLNDTSAILTTVPLQ